MQPDQKALQEGANAAHSSSEHMPNIGITWMGVLLPMIYGMLGALIAVVSLTLFPLLPASESHRIATVDVLKIMDAYDAEAIDAIKQGDSAAAQRAAENRAKRGAELDKLLERIAHERGLLLVQKQAVLGGETQDLTSEIMRMMESGQ